MKGDDQAVENTDRELWRETPGEAFSPSIHVTQAGGIGINVGGTVFVQPVRHWHALIDKPDYFVARGCTMRAEIRSLCAVVLILLSGFITVLVRNEYNYRHRLILERQNDLLESQLRGSRVYEAGLQHQI